MQRIDILIWSNSKREYIPLGLASPDAPVELPDKLELAYEQRPNQLPNGIPVRFGPAQGQEDRHRERFRKNIGRVADHMRSQNVVAVVRSPDLTQTLMFHRLSSTGELVAILTGAAPPPAQPPAQQPPPPPAQLPAQAPPPPAVQQPPQAYALAPLDQMPPAAPAPATLPPHSSAIVPESNPPGYPPAPSTEPLQPPPKRQRTAHAEGERIEVRSNFAPLLVSPELVVYQYDVSIQTKDGGPVKTAEGRRDIMERMQPGLLLSHAEHGWSYNGDKVLYTARQRLSVPGDGNVGGWVVVGEQQFEKADLCRDGSRGVSVKISSTGTELSYAEFGGGGGTRVQSAAHTAVLDVLLRHQTAKVFKMLGDAYYGERKEKAYFQKVPMMDINEIWVGYKLSCVHTVNGPMMQIDHGAVATLAPKKLLAFIRQKLRGSRGRGGHVRSDAEVDAQLLTEEKVGHKLTNGPRLLKATSSHSARVYTLRGLDSVPAAQAMFTDENGRELSVADYFAAKYPHVRLSYADRQPCALVGKKTDPASIKVPLELLELAEAQPPQASQSEIASEMIKVCSQAPAERFKIIEQVTADYKTGNVGPSLETADDSRRRFETFTLQVDSLTAVEARVMPPCKIMYKGRNGKPEEAPIFDGAWNLRGVSFFEPGTAKDWAIVECVPVDMRAPEYKEFQRTFEQLARERNVAIGRYQGVERYDERLVRSDGIGALLQRAVTQLRVGLLVCVIGDSLGANTPTYAAIKRWSHCAPMGIPTQCVQQSKALVCKGGKGGGRGGDFY
mmetsp:Transcript_62675/g.166555  ORF Transcript_62675/g.166555 Transcript_62675/m.166555 type:complete len:783 (+) Transcript_62675:97-2445(+)